MVKKMQNVDVKLYYSTASMGGANYLGGARSTQELSNNFLHNLLEKTSEAEQITGIVKLRCVYIYNANPNFYLKNPYVFVVADTNSPSDYVEVGWGTAEIGTGLSGATDGSIEQEIADQYTSPEDVEFFKANFRSGGAILNSDIPPLKAKAVWIRYTSLFNAQDVAYNTFRLRFGADNLISTAPEKTGPPPPPLITFTVFGECSSDEDFTRMVSSMLPSNPHMVVTVGNNNVDSNPNFFITTMGTAISKTLLGWGPKDVVNSTVINAYVNKMATYNFAPGLANRYYSKTFGNVHILFMDTSGGQQYGNPSPQYTFILQDLSAAFTDPNIDWIFVVTNKPLYGSQTTSSSRYYYEDIAKTYHEVFTRNGVLVVFQGGFNFYERSKVLKFNPLDISNPSAFAYDGPDNYDLFGKKSFVDGEIYITCGTGGNGHDTIPTPVAYSQVRDTVDFGYVRVIVENNLAHPKVTFRFYETSRSAQIFVDQFTVQRIE